MFSLSEIFLLYIIRLPVELTTGKVSFKLVVLMVSVNIDPAR